MESGTGGSGTYLTIANTAANHTGLNANGYAVTLMSSTLRFADASDPGTGQPIGQEYTGTINFTGTSGIAAGASLELTGQVNVLTGASGQISGQNLTNSGTISINADAALYSLAIDPTMFTNTGTIEVAQGNGTVGGALMIGQSWSSPSTSGNWTNGATGVIESVAGTSNAGTRITLGGTWSNLGVITFHKNDSIVLAGNFHPADIGMASSGSNGQLTPNGAWIDITGTIDNSNNTLAFNTNNAAWNLKGGTIENGILAVGLGTGGVPYLNINGGTLQNVTLGSDLTSAGFYIANTVGNSLGLDPQGYAVNLSGSNVSLNFTDALNSATGQYVGQVYSGVINVNNAWGATMNVGQSLQFNGTLNMVGLSGMTLTGQNFSNTGTLNIGTGAQTSNLDLYASVVANSGSINVGSSLGGGALTIDGDFTNTGRISVYQSNATAGWGQLTLSGNWTNGPTGIIESVPGSAKYDPVFNFIGTWSNSGSMSFHSGDTVILGGTFSPSDVGLGTGSSQGTFSPGGATVIVTGTIEGGGTALNFNNSTGYWTLATNTYAAAMKTAFSSFSAAALDSSPAFNNGTIVGSTLSDALDPSGNPYLIIQNGTLQNVTLGSNLYIGGSTASGMLTLANTTSNPDGVDPQGHTITMGTNSGLYFSDAINTTTGQPIGQTYNGVISLRGAAAAIYSTATGSSLTIGGQGAINAMATTGANSIQVYNLTNDGQINAGAPNVSGNTLTIRASTISGPGTIHAYSGNTVNIQFDPLSTWTESGTLVADSGASINISNQNGSSVNVEFASGSVLDVQFGGNGASGSVHIAGGVTIDSGAILDISLLPGATFSGPYDFLNYTGSAPTGTFTLGAPGYKVDYSSTPGEILLESVPEPVVWLTIVAGGIASVLCRRRHPLRARDMIA